MEEETQTGPPIPDIDELCIMKLDGDPGYRDEVIRTVEELVRQRDFDEIYHYLTQLDEDLGQLSVLEARVCSGLLKDVAADIETAFAFISEALAESGEVEYVVFAAAMDRQLRHATASLRQLRRHGYRVRDVHRALESVTRQKKSAMIRRRFHLWRASRKLRKLNA